MVGSPDSCGGNRRDVRVAVVTESFLPAVNGVTNSVLHVIAHLRAQGHDAIVVAPGPGPDEVPESADPAGSPSPVDPSPSGPRAGRPVASPSARRAAEPRVPVIRVPAVDLPVVDSLPVGVPTPAVRAAIAEFRPDVVHLASPFVLGARALTVARRLRIPTVAVYQTDVAGFAASYGIGLTARAAWRWIRRLHAGADRTLAPSRWAVETLRAHGIPRVHRWGRGVDTARFHPDRRRSDGARQLRRRLAPNGELLVGYVGRLAAEKQVDRLAALEGVPGVRVVVIGDGPARGRLSAALPTAEFLGFQGGTALAEVHAALDVFVHTGPFETFCQAVQEAQASGVPVLAPDAGGVADLVDPGRTGKLFAPDPVLGAAQLRAGVEAWRDAPEDRRAIGRAARVAVADRTWPAVCDELLGHYDELVGPSRPTGARPRAA